MKSMEEKNVIVSNERISSKIEIEYPDSENCRSE